MEWGPIKTRLPLTENKLMEYEKMSKQQLITAITERDKQIELLSTDDKNTVIVNMQEEITALNKENATKAGIIEKLSDKVSKQDTAKKGAPETVEHEGETYRVALPALEYGKRIITVADLRAEGGEKLVKELVEMQSGMLVKITV